jgi:hypothetical protein
MNDVKILLELFTRGDLLKQEAAEALVHALVDIKLSINNVYDKVLPQLIQKQGSMTKEQVLEGLWELREQFRHIDYHIKDSNITNL